MDRSTPISLIASERKQDKRGVLRKSKETVRTVFANVQSAFLQEFHEGYRNGLNPQFVFSVFYYDYRGESVVEYNGERYGVYRTRRKGTDTIELYAQRKGGVNVGGCDNGP